MTPDRSRAFLEDLQAWFPEVILTPSRRPEERSRGGMIRTAIAFNPAWYRALCHAHQKHRTRTKRTKTDTRIVRRDVIKRLEWVASGGTSKSGVIAWLDASGQEPEGDLQSRAYG